MSWSNNVTPLGCFQFSLWGPANRKIDTGHIVLGFNKVSEILSTHALPRPVVEPITTQLITPGRQHPEGCHLIVDNHRCTLKTNPDNR